MLAVRTEHSQVRARFASGQWPVLPPQRRGRGASQSVDTPFGRVYYDAEGAGSGVALDCPEGISDGIRRFSFGSMGMRCTPWNFSSATILCASAPSATVNPSPGHSKSD